MKLNYKKTIYVGFAFFLICAFWQAYDTIVSLMLCNKFGLNQTWSGVILALDNILALFMLPLFGSLSDKSKSKKGRRTPFIIIGAIVSMVLFMSLTFADNLQLTNLQNSWSTDGSTMQTAIWDNSYTEEYDNKKAINNNEYSAFSNKEVPKEFMLKDYSANILFNKNYNELNETEKLATQTWFYSLETDNGFYYYDKDNAESPYTLLGKKYDSTNDLYLQIAKTSFINYQNATSIDEISTEDLSSIIAKCKTLEVSGGKFIYNTANGVYTYEKAEGLFNSTKSGTNAYSTLLCEARNNYAWNITTNNKLPIILFISILLLLLIAMSTFRSPAVALMPDVTVKPLRSKGNAIINAMGTVGGILVLGLGIIFGTGSVANQIMPYVWYVFGVVMIMAIGLAIFIWKVREVPWFEQMKKDSKELGIDDEEEAINVESDEEINQSVSVEKPKDSKLSKGKLIALLLILGSVFLWYMGYNAVSSKYSLYATKVLNKSYALTLALASGTALIAFIPIGILSIKIGRKKTILIGIGFLAGAFLGASFLDSDTPSIVMNIFFIFAGIGWASINVNSFPMVVELSKNGDIGKYTGYYYTASMAAQIITPIFSGALMDIPALSYKILFPYATLFVALSFITMLFVKYGDSKTDKLEQLMPEVD